MSDPIVGTATVKGASALMATVAAGKATVDVIRHHEPMFLGAAQSVLMAAIAGALIGVYLFQDAERSSILPVQGHGWRPALALGWRVCGLGFGVLCFAFVSAWSVTAASLWLSDEITVLAPACAGILAVFVKKLLPKYLEVLQGIGDAVRDAVARVLGKRAP